MNVFGIIIVVVLCLVLAIALFFEIRGLIKSVRVYKQKKNLKKENKTNTSETNEDK